MATLIILRIVHIGFGVFWAGGVMFMNFILGPSLAAAGPDGFRVMQEMNKRRYFPVIMTAALLTILSGLELLRRDSGNYSAAWFKSPMGMGLSTGMVAAIIAFLIGGLGIGPTMKRMGMIGSQMMQTPPEARGELMAQLTAVRGRMIAFSSVAILFIIIAVLAMATARYL